MNILIIGSGGREHALAWRIAQSSHATHIIMAQGNDGCKLDNIDTVSIKPHEKDALIHFAQKNAIDFCIIGAEDPLVDGLADDFNQAGILCLGPSKKAAQLEGSKLWMKQFCADHHIPTAPWHLCRSREEARACITKNERMRIIKQDSLAAGKGVVVAKNKQEALTAANNLFAKGEQKILIEEKIEGDEISVFALLDGTRAILLGSARDHKRAFDHDEGPNTGGMGAYSHDQLIHAALEEKIKRQFILPVAQGMAKQNMPYRGILFAGLMVKGEEARLLEYNIRFGDPECQTLMMRLKNDLLPLFHHAAQGTLRDEEIEFSSPCAMTLVIASQGYPHESQTGWELKGIGDNYPHKNVRFFHAATKQKEGRWYAAGGRVLNICASGDHLNEARQLCYETLAHLSCQGGFWRTDIGQK